jgi:hypothetical protein
VSDEETRNCEHCRAALERRQRWCLECGSATMRRIAATPRWHATATGAALLALAALAGIGYAVATLIAS